MWYYDVVVFHFTFVNYLDKNHPSPYTEHTLWLNSFIKLKAVLKAAQALCYSLVGCCWRSEQKAINYSDHLKNEFAESNFISRSVL